MYIGSNYIKLRPFWEDFWRLPERQGNIFSTFRCLCTHVHSSNTVLLEERCRTRYLRFTQLLHCTLVILTSFPYRTARIWPQTERTLPLYWWIRSSKAGSSLEKILLYRIAIYRYRYICLVPNRSLKTVAGTLLFSPSHKPPLRTRFHAPSARIRTHSIKKGGDCGRGSRYMVI